VKITTVSNGKANITGSDRSGSLVVQTSAEWEGAENLAFAEFENSKDECTVILDAQNLETQDAFLRAVPSPTGFSIVSRNTTLAPGVTYECNYIVIDR
jgi:hypothetical protein